MASGKAPFNRSSRTTASTGCESNLSNGLYVIAITLPDKIAALSQLAENKNLADRIDCFDVEQFVSVNLYEISRFAAAHRRTTERPGCNHRCGEWEGLLDRRSLGVVGYAPISGGDAAFGPLISGHKAPPTPSAPPHFRLHPSGRDAVFTLAALRRRRDSRVPWLFPGGGRRRPRSDGGSSPAWSAFRRPIWGGSPGKPRLRR